MMSEKGLALLLRKKMEGRMVLIMFFMVLEVSIVGAFLMY
jgi:hypothetical protein